MIEFRGLSKTFESNEGSHKALHDINLTIDDRDIFGIIGPSGAGKSTLVRCINLLERPTSGQVFIDQVDVTNFKGRKLRALRSKIGMIFQDFNLFSQRTVLQNVLFPLEVSHFRKPRVADDANSNDPRSESAKTGATSAPQKDAPALDPHLPKKASAQARARELLELVGLKDMEARYPAQLSGGQQQRVAIARALANHPEYLLCDEATSALDTLTTDSILELIKRINREMGVTVVVITHAMSVVEAACNKVAVIDNSHIVEQGSVREVFSAPKAEITRRLLRVEGGDLHA